MMIATLAYLWLFEEQTQIQYLIRNIYLFQKNFFSKVCSKVTAYHIRGTFLKKFLAKIMKKSCAILLIVIIVK